MLFIVLAGGGEARRMSCNTSKMNSWHSWSPNSRWLVFSSKANRPYTQMFLTHVDADGNDSPAILIPDSTADNRAVNLPEFANMEPAGIAEILTPSVDYRRLLDHAVALRDQGRLDDSEEELRKSLELRPDYAETRRIFAGVLAEEGRNDEAIDAYRGIIELEPDNASAISNLGFLLNRTGEDGEAIELYRRSLEIDPRQRTGPTSISARCWRAWARTKKPKITSAKLSRSIRQTHRFIVSSAWSSTDRVILVSQFPTSNPPSKPILNNRARGRRLALTYLRLGEDEKAIVHLKQLVQRRPRDIELRKKPRLRP